MISLAVILTHLNVLFKGNIMIAIQTKVIKATNTNGARIKAFTSSGFSATIPYPYQKSDELCHFEAVKALVEKHQLNWGIDDMAYGGIENGYVFCFRDSIVEVTA
jgi:hypothetical protein